MDNYTVSSYENCTNVEPISTPYPVSMKVHIPKYMPKINAGNWEQRVSIGGNIFVNAPECSSNITNIVTERGYCGVSIYSNETPDFSEKFDFNQKCIPIGNNFIIEVMYEDIATRKLTGKV